MNKYTLLCVCADLFTIKTNCKAIDEAQEQEENA